MLLKSNLVPQSVVVTPKREGRSTRAPPERGTCAPNPPPPGCNKTVLLYKENVKGGRSLCRGAASCRQARPPQPPPPPTPGGEGGGGGRSKRAYECRHSSCLHVANVCMYWNMNQFPFLYGDKKLILSFPSFSKHKLGSTHC
jgi:hypothetical protein